MPLPRFHSCTWSDEQPQGAGQLPPHEPATPGPESLKDKELSLWVTYPDVPGRGKGKKGQGPRRPLKLWAVVIIEELRPIDAFTYEVVLKRVFKAGERLIKVWVKNDPAEPSEDAGVFGFLRPQPSQLSPLEQHLAQLAAKRVYDAIAETWSESNLKQYEAAS
jgi:hypothetical protein